MHAAARRARWRWRSAYRNWFDPGWTFKRQWRDRLRGDAYRSAFDEVEPLVTICIATYNRSRLLIERSLRSSLAQTYRNIEVIVVGDHCTDDTAELVAQLGDDRVRFVNRESRGAYPEDKMLRWMVAGSIPMNDAMRLARGSFVTHLDDDDEHAPDRIALLVEFAQRGRVDFVWHPFEVEQLDGRWSLNAAPEFAYGGITTSSVFYHRVWKEIEWDPQCFHLKEPGDWNRFRKIRWLGARIARYPTPLLKHYRERSQMGR